MKTKSNIYFILQGLNAYRKENVHFRDLKDVYFLAITNFSPFPNKKTWFSKIGLKDLETNEHDIKAIQLFFLQLPLFKKGKKDLKSMSVKEKWAYFFKYAEETNDQELEDLIGEDLIIRRAYQELDRFGWSEAELNTYDSIEMKQAADEGVREAVFDMGHAAGIEEGEKKKSLEIAKKLLANCLAVSIE